MASIDITLKNKVYSSVRDMHSRAVEVKNAGNEAFDRKQWLEAAAHYDHANRLLARYGTEYAEVQKICAASSTDSSRRKNEQEPQEPVSSGCTEAIVSDGSVLDRISCLENIIVGAGVDGPEDQNEQNRVDDLLATTYCNLSACCLELGDFRGAVENANACLLYHPTRVKALYRRGVGWMRLGELEKAEADLTAVQIWDSHGSVEVAARREELAELMKKEGQEIIEKPADVFAAMDRAFAEAGL